LDCDSNQLTSLDVSGLTELNYLVCHSNQLSSLDVSGLTELNYLYCNSNQLTSLDVSGTGLNTLYCPANQLTSSAVDTIIIDMASIANAYNYQYGSLYIQGQTPAAPPTSASSAALATLDRLHWTVLHD
jgi:Leucine-rich repeat (LRR) protein